MPSRLAAAACLIALASGCLWAGKRPPATPVRAEPESPVTVLRTAIADRPAGDYYLSNEIWAGATRPLPHELAALLARNGLRAGIISGVPPAAFVALLGNPGALLDPKDRGFFPGKSGVIPVAGPLPRAEFALTATVAADPVPHSFDAAECALSVALTKLEGGRVELECEPRFQYGEPRGFILPTADATFTRRERKMREPLAHLTFKVKLDPGEALIFGPTDEPVGTLGGAFFVEANPSRARQRLLVVQLKR